MTRSENLATNPAPSPDSDWKRRYYDCVRMLDEVEHQVQRQTAQHRRSLSRLTHVIAAMTPGADPFEALREPLREADDLEAVERAIGEIARSLVDQATDTKAPPITPDLLQGLATLLDALPAGQDSGNQVSALRAALADIRQGNQVAPLLRRTAQWLREQADAGHTLTATGGDLLEPLRSGLNRLIDVLPLAPQSRETGDKLRHYVGALQKLDELPGALEKLAEIAEQGVEQWRRERHTVSEFMASLDERLRNIGDFLALQERQAGEAGASREQMGARVSEELKGIAEAIGDPAQIDQDLTRLQLRLQNHLDAIHQGIAQYRQAEQSRETLAREEREKLRQRVASLEEERGDLQRQLVELAEAGSRDALTGLLNRGALDDRLRHEWERAQRYRQPLSLVMLDVDHFKHLNDTLGHAAGDQVLKALARIVTEALRDSDTVGRYGGEEFTVILPGTARQEGLQAAEKLRLAVAGATFRYRGERVPLTVSCGIAECAPGEPVDAALARADQALYAAKAAGRNCSSAAPDTVSEPSAPAAAGAVSGR